MGATTTFNGEPCQWRLTELFEEQFANTIDTEAAELAIYQASEIDLLFISLLGGDHANLSA